jgi:hypothetical protein
MHKPSIKSRQSTQQETIVWHGYPQEKPPKDGYYLITAHNVINAKAIIYIAIWAGGIFGTGFNVIAWAELPTGWKDGNNE